MCSNIWDRYKYSAAYQYFRVTQSGRQSPKPFQLLEYQTRVRRCKFDVDILCSMIQAQLCYNDTKFFFFKCQTFSFQFQATLTVWVLMLTSTVAVRALYSSQAIFQTSNWGPDLLRNWVPQQILPLRLHHLVTKKTRLGTRLAYFLSVWNRCTYHCSSCQWCCREVSFLSYVPPPKWEVILVSNIHTLKLKAKASHHHHHLYHNHQLTSSPSWTI